MSRLLFPFTRSKSIREQSRHSNTCKKFSLLVNFYTSTTFGCVCDQIQLLPWYLADPQENQDRYIVIYRSMYPIASNKGLIFFLSSSLLSNWCVAGKTDKTGPYPHSPDSTIKKIGPHCIFLYLFMQPARPSAYPLPTVL